MEIVPRKIVKLEMHKATCIFECIVKKTWKSGAGVRVVGGCGWMGSEAVTVKLSQITSSITTEEVLASLPDYTCSCLEGGITNLCEVKCREKLINIFFLWSQSMKRHMNRRTENEQSAKKQSPGMFPMSLLCKVCNLEDRCYNFLESGKAVPAL